ncbi:haloacid dehalogenase [Crassaminicella thermophila]|uniref:Haloacid dehalogenase n=1 Tax=Crassaminicella thermophila TaxID=2599308 RepID=A0A5C0SCT3_CRATE|nr:HAD family hydrolase [Crassaminicella thermophila]QEK11014.1 haloacid dehalogenase [Crassaminicella thermophila]
MIFASDLDRTLIYSKKFVSNDEGIKLIETKGKEEISFMTKKAIKRLKKLSEEILFIPVTTRTIEQYRRISLFQEEIRPKYAIVSNGGNILINGEIDYEWNNIIQKKIKEECISFKEVESKFEEIESNQWVINRKVADNLFSYCIIHPEYVPEVLYSFIDWMEDNNWKVSLQGRKLYFVPCCVCKWEATQYIKMRENIDFVASAGDSLLDLPMLKMADYAVVPPHGEIYKKYERTYETIQNITFTEKEGIFAAEEILEKIYGLIKQPV